MKTQFTHSDYEITQRDLLYQGLFRMMRYHIRQRLFKGGWSDIFTREVLERFSAAAVLPYDPVLDRVILIEQFRPGAVEDPITPWMIEIPAGVLFDNNETYEELARHEAVEEAGCHIEQMELICEYLVSPGASTESLTLYCGKTDASQVSGIHGLAIEHEDIRVHNVSVVEALAMLKAGTIKTSPAIISLLWLQLNRERLKANWK